MIVNLRLVAPSAPTSTDSDLIYYLRWGRELAGYSDATIRVREAVLRRLGQFLACSLREATSHDLRAWEHQYVAGRSAATRRAYVSHVVAFYSWLVKMEAISENPTKGLTRPKTPKPLPRPIGEEDLRLAIDAASPKLGLMLILMAYASLRCMEVAQLQWQDIVDVDGQTILHVRHGKGDKDRSVPLGDFVRTALRKHGPRKQGPVFYGRNAGQIRPASVSTMVNEHLKRLGIDSTAHKLRHRFATVSAPLVDNDLSLIAELCGWDSLQTARHYVMPNRSKTIQLLGGLDQLASSPRPVLGIDGPEDERRVASPYRPTVDELGLLTRSRVG